MGCHRVMLLLLTLGSTGLMSTELLGFSQTKANQQGKASEERSSNSTQEPSNRGSSNDTSKSEPSEAERIARLNRAITETEQRLKDLRSTLDNPESEYSKAHAKFQQLDTDLQTKRKDLEKARQDNRQDAAALLEESIKKLEPEWKLVKERFDLLIQERRTQQDQIVTLEKKLQQDKDALSKLTASPVSPVDPGQTASGTVSSGDVTNGTGSSNEAKGSGGINTQESPGALSPNGAATPTQTLPTGSAVPGGTGGVGGSITGSATSDASKGDAQEQNQSILKKSPPSRELLKAQETAKDKESQAVRAEQEVRSLEERIETVRKSLEQEKQLLSTARKKAGNALETEQAHGHQIDALYEQGAPHADLKDLRAKRDEAHQRFEEARAEVTKVVDNIGTLQSELGRLQNEKILALEQAEQKRQEAESARKKVEKLENPFTPINILNWLLRRGPKIIAIALGMAVFLWLVRWGEKRLIRFITRGSDHGTLVERKSRATTLVGVFRNAATVAIVIGGVLMLLVEIGINVAPLLGGAAVLGLAVAFGAQNLIRDYFSGFMILVENQYTINDVVKIGDVGGLVEAITLRVTVLRDLEGVVHFIPNGEITRVSNMTHGWSRALFNIGVAYKEDTDQVIDVLMNLGRELRQDPNFQHMILENPEMLGVDGFGDSAVTIKFFIKTRPLMQWSVKREMLRRIKKRFDELGIEIPYPHRTIFHHHVDRVAPTRSYGD